MLVNSSVQQLSLNSYDSHHDVTLLLVTDEFFGDCGYPSVPAAVLCCSYCQLEGGRLNFCEQHP